MNLCGLRRKLPLLPLGPKLKIASFNLLGDAELVGLLAQEIIERIKYFDFDLLVGVEAKTLPLIYEISRAMGKDRYVILRKQYAGYMVNPVKAGNGKNLFIDSADVKIVKGKKVIIIDDVISTGRTVAVGKELIERTGGKLIAVAVVIKQGIQDFSVSVPLLYLTTLPLFRK